MANRLAAQVAPLGLAAPLLLLLRSRVSPPTASLPALLHTIEE